MGAREVPNASDYYYDDNDPYLEPGGRRRRRDREIDLDDVGVIETSPVG